MCASTAFGRDQRDAQVAAKVWHHLMYRKPGLPVFGTRLEHVEHIGFALVLAERAGVPATRFVHSGMGGADTAILMTKPPPGTALADMPVEQVTDDVLAAAWAAVHDLHAAGISHGNLDAHRGVVDSDGTIAFDDFSATTRHERPVLARS